MALPPLPNVVRTAFIHQLNGAEVVNVVNWRFAATVTPQQIETLAEQCSLQWTTWPMAACSQDLVFVRVEARQAVPGAGLAFDWDNSPVVPGGNLASCNNNQTATVVSLRTGQAGRSYKGRLYISGVPDAVPDNGLLPLAWRTNMADGIWQTLNAIAGLANCEPVVVSYFSNKQQRAVPVVTEIISALCVTPYPAGQERRRPGIGS